MQSTPRGGGLCGAGNPCALFAGFVLDFFPMVLTRQQVMTWAPSDILAEGSRLQSSGAVQGTQAQGNLLAGSVRMGASRLVVRLRLPEDGVGRPETLCHCSAARGGKVCAHAVAVGLQWAHDHGGAEAKEALTFSAERAPTREEILRWAGPTLMARAEALVKRGGVTRIDFRYPVGKGYANISGTPVLATFRMLPNGLVEGHCPCYVSRDQGMLCEHVIAVALGVMHHYGNEARRRVYAEERARLARLAQAKGMIVRGKTGTPAVVRVFLPADVPGQFAQGGVRVAVRLFVEGRALRPQEVPPGTYAVSEGDENLMGVLEDISGGPFPDAMTLERADFLALLRCAARSWVGFAATRRRLTVGEPLETPLRISAEPEHDALRVEVVVPEGGAGLLVEGRTGWWLSGETVRPLAKVLPVPFHMLYREPVRVGRDRVMAFFASELPALSGVLPLAPESITQDLFTVTPAVPAFRLELRGSPASVSARLAVEYRAGQTLWAGGQEPVSLPDPDDFYHCFVRNPEAEKAALERVREMGFYGSRGDDLGSVTGVREVLNLLGKHVTAVRRDGWHVTVAGPLASFFDEAEVIVPVVRVKAEPPTPSSGQPPSAAAAFEVTTDYVSPRGTVRVTPAEIERAMACGNAYVEKDGKTALIDIGAIRTLRETLASCAARAGHTPGSSRVEAVHAPFVQAALERLEGIDFEAAPDWRARASAQNRERAPEPVDLGRLEGTLRPYQKEGVYWLRFLEACGFCGILADEMGLGKTLQTLTWLQLPRCREEARRAPALIVCPTSLTENWNREAEKFVPWLRRLVVSGPDRAPLFAQVPERDLVITSYALIRRDIEFYAQCRFSAVVLDEAQAIKNRTTQNAQAVKQLVADTRLVLSGTPIENGVADLWSIMDFLMPRYLGPYDDFKLRYEDAVALGGPEAENAQRRLREKLHPFLLRRVKKDVAKDLPDKIRTVTYCDLSPAQRRLYDDLRAKTRDEVRALAKAKGFEKSKFEMLARLMRLRQICCDLRLLKDRPLRPGEEPSSKLDALMELLHEAIAGGHRLLVFSQFTSMLRLIAERLEAEGLPYCYLDGATKDRLAQCARFNQTPSIPAFLISLKAGGTGLNLTGADTVVHFDPWWNPAAEEQATDRAHRIGQKKTVQAIKLIAQDTIEEKVLELQRRKQSLIEATVNASDASVLSTLTMAEIEDLLA